MNKIDRQKHVSLLSHELAYQKNQFEIEYLQKQFNVLVKNNEAFIAQFLGIDEKRGNLILKFSLKRGVPLKNRQYVGFVPANDILKSKNWINLSYGELRTLPSRVSELIPIWYRTEGDNIVIGFKGANVEFLNNVPANCPVIIGPDEPPLAYLNNLIQLVGRLKQEDKGAKFLDLKIGEAKWQPTDLNKFENYIKEIMLAFEFCDEIIIQGPPGTGKTYLMADLCKYLLSKKAKILVTTLTNSALIELASKEHLSYDINLGNVYKTNIAIDELKKLPNLKEGRNYEIHANSLLLSTYYIMSDISNRSFDGEIFDYVIIEEASQAFLSTIAAAHRLGKKCLIIGDIAQLEPIFGQQINKENKDNLKEAINGLNTVCQYSTEIPSYILTKSHRLTNRAVNFTNWFYNGKLTSITDEDYNINLKLPAYLNEIVPSNGGPVWLKLDLEIDEKLPANASDFISTMVSDLHGMNPALEIAVLSFFRSTTNKLQSRIYSEVKNTENVLVETVSRIQGLTTDICIYFIPNSGVHFSLNSNLFNVATSRAKLLTIIISSANLLEHKYINEGVVSYFCALK